MRISDWSSDVCSSDLSVAQAGDRGGVLATTKGLPGPLDQPRQQRLQSLAGLDRKRERPAVLQFLAEPIYRRRLAAADLVQPQDSAGIEESIHRIQRRAIGRASCRERACHFV